jgi:hypothetical protein
MSMYQPARTIDLYRWAPGVVFSESYRCVRFVKRPGRPVVLEMGLYPYSDAAEDAAKAANVWLALILAGRRGRV